MKYREALANGWKVAFPIRYKGKIDSDVCVCDKELKQGGGRRKRLMYVEVPADDKHHMRLYLKREVAL